MMGAVASVFSLSTFSRLLTVPFLNKLGKMVSWVGEYSSIVLSVHAYILLIFSHYVFGPTINDWVNHYGLWVGLLLTLIVSIGSAVVGALLLYKIPLAQRVYVNRNWPIK